MLYWKAFRLPHTYIPIPLEEFSHHACKYIANMRPPTKATYTASPRQGIEEPSSLYVIPRFLFQPAMSSFSLCSPPPGLLRSIPNPRSPATQIHGFPDISMGWRYQIPMLLSLGLRVVAPDCMGYGRTVRVFGQPQDEVIRIRRFEGWTHLDVKFAENDDDGLMTLILRMHLPTHYGTTPTKESATTWQR